jgi:membrane associated rhomboid family serine protease
VIAGASIFAGVFSALLRPFQLMFWPRYQRQQRQDHQVSLGFSGVNAALLYLFAVVSPEAGLSIMNLPGMPAKGAVGRLIGFDLIGMLVNMTVFPSPVGHTNHLGGFLSAAIMRYILCFTPVGRQLSTRRERFALCGALF